MAVKLYNEYKLADLLTTHLEQCDIDDLAMLASSTLTDDPVQVTTGDYEDVRSRVFQNGVAIDGTGLDVEEVGFTDKSHEDEADLTDE